MLPVISLTSSTKSVGPNSRSIEILKLLKNNVPNQLGDIFNISFSTGVFPNILKVVKVVPVYEKDSKFVYWNYRPNSLSSNIKKDVRNTNVQYSL